MRTGIVVVAAVALAGCATSSTTYLPDGRAGHTLYCGGPYLGWGDCQQKAGEICQARGYDVVAANENGVPISVSSSSSYASATTTTFNSASRSNSYSGVDIKRTMLIGCR